MKTLMVAIGLVAAVSCTSVREIQVEMIQAQLIKIDTIHRLPNEYQKLLTWRGADNIDYISFVSMDQVYPLGVSFVVMKTK